MQTTTFLLLLSIYLVIGVGTLIYSAWESATLFCKMRIEQPGQPVNIQFSNLYFQMLAWPAFIAVKMVQRKYQPDIQTAEMKFLREQRVNG
jgi:hypothetical protein